MDSPVSAFAIYKANRPTKPKKNKKKKSPKVAISPKPVPKEPDHLMIQIAKKGKRQQEKQKSKNITKKKSLKKKKAKKEVNKVKVKNSSVENGVNSRLRQDSITISESDEEAPMLIPVNPIGEKQCLSDDGSCSHSSGFDFVPVQTNSEEEGLKIFKWMIAPYDPMVFLRKIWEKAPLHISRKKSRYYLDLISTPNIDNMLRNENIQFTKNIDITSYVDGKRETHNPEGRAHPRVVWDAYLDGCSIRLLNPQTYLPKLHLLNATLQEYFNCFVGANSYLTPPDSQGFAPHYDDIEAFILQVEGKKHWRIYKPLNDYEVLPRVSSKNFDQNEIGEPCMEVTLEAGDMLYFPRGYIHQGVTIDGEHSLHITISMYQKNSWADLFEKLIPIALEGAINCDVQFREGLPRDIFDHFGFATSDSTPRRNILEEKIKSLFDKMKDFLQIDPAVDEVAKKFQHDALPPILNDYEKAVTVYGDNDAMIENGKVVNRVEFSLDTRVRLLRKNILRMVCEERTIRLYFYTENSLEYHGNEPTYLEIDDGIASVIETLMTTYPEYVSIENLSDEINETEKLETVEELWSKGIIMTEYPLPLVEDD